jgi:molybdopterin-guanine dinucleotide biosynthesis protein A
MRAVSHAREPDLAIVILAGGRATRFPGKLEAALDGEPLLARVYRAMRAVAPVTIAGRDTFSSALDALLDCPIVVDRWPDRGPLGGLLSACQELHARFVFAVAGDAPMVTREVVDALRAAVRDGDEAVVPTHGGRLEPLAALYLRDALVREGLAAIGEADRSMHGVLQRLRTREVVLDERYFVNVNTAADAASIGIRQA